MNEKINIFDVELDSFTAKSAMRQAVEYLESDSINLVEVVTLDMLLQEKENKEWKEQTAKLDMILPGEEGILQAAKITDIRLLKDVSGKIFLKMFFRYLQKNHKKIILITSDEKMTERLKKAIQKNHKGMIVTGACQLDENRSQEEIVNEINGMEADCILSFLPAPLQENFIVNNKALLNVKLWLGCGSTLAERYIENGTGGIKYYFMKKRFLHLAGRHIKNSSQDKKEES